MKSGLFRRVGRMRARERGAARLPCVLALAGLAAARAADGQAADALYPLRLLDRPTTLPRGPSASTSSRSRRASRGRRPRGPGSWGAASGSFSEWRLAANSSRSRSRRATHPSVAPTLSVDTRADGAGTSLSLPMTFMRQVSPQVNWQIASGLGLSRFDPRFGLSRRSQSLEFDDVTVPFSAEFMYSLGHRARRHLLADLTLRWLLPQAYTNVPGQRGVHLNDWTLQLRTS